MIRYLSNSESIRCQYLEFMSEKTNLEGTWSAWVRHNIGRKSYFGQQTSKNLWNVGILHVSQKFNHKDRLNGERVNPIAETSLPLESAPGDLRFRCHAEIAVGKFPRVWLYAGKSYSTVLLWSQTKHVFLSSLATRNVLQALQATCILSTESATYVFSFSCSTSRQWSSNG